MTAEAMSAKGVDALSSPALRATRLLPPEQYYREAEAAKFSPAGA